MLYNSHLSSGPYALVFKPCHVGNGRDRLLAMELPWLSRGTVVCRPTVLHFRAVMGLSWLSSLVYISPLLQFTWDVP